MIPIYDDNPTRRFTWVTLFLIGLNIGAFGYMLSLGDAELSAFIAERAFVAGDFFADPTDPHRLLTLFTAMFLHAGWLHLGGNMLYLWIFGNNVEERLGHGRFVLFYLTAGVVATLVQSATAPDSTIPLVGASGAIAGILGAYMWLFPRARVVTLIPVLFIVEIAAIPAVFVIGFWFLLQVVQGVGSIGMIEGGVAWWAHVAGFVFGLAVAIPITVFGRGPRAATSRRVRRSARRDR